MFNLVEENEFFAPTTHDVIDGLIGQYQSKRAKIEQVADMMNGEELKGVISYFADYASSMGRHISSSTAAKMFHKDGAIAFLNAAFWSKAMHMTDVLNVMPQARKDAWHEQMRCPMGEKKSNYSSEWKIEPLPEFNEEDVRNTIIDLLNQRSKFFAERVDGIFQSLSRNHVTNQPEGFGKRMIIENVCNEWAICQYRKTGVINDLRCVIAKFMGRDEPRHGASDQLVNFARKHRTGQWVNVDGGALRIRCYLKGTAHLEVHPDVAWRLNSVLAQLYPLAIPSHFREKPKKKAKEFAMLQRPLPFAVLNLLGSLKKAQELNPRKDARGENTFVYVPGCYDIGRSDSKHVNKEVADVLASLGGVEIKQGRWMFDYDVLELIGDIVHSGCIPDQKSHQFYPTPEKLARIAVELAGIKLHHKVLEPSAGTGGIADYLPKDQTMCAEISPMHCKVLEQKGYKVICGDFLSYRETGIDRIVMNPPFSEGRWQAHTRHAAGMLNTGGRLVAILPSSAKNSFQLDGMEIEWHGPYHNEFSSTSISVVILVATENRDTM